MAMSLLCGFSAMKLPSVDKNHVKQPLSLKLKLKQSQSQPQPQKPKFFCNCASNEFSAAFNLTGLNQVEQDVFSIIDKITDIPEVRQHMDQVLLGDAPKSRLCAFTVALIDEKGTIREKLDSHIIEHIIDDKLLFQGSSSLLLENADNWVSTRSLVSRSFNKFFDKIYDVLQSQDFISEMNTQDNINCLELMVQMVVDKPISHKGIKNKEDFKKFLGRLSTASIEHVGAKTASYPISKERLNQIYSHTPIDGL